MAILDLIMPAYGSFQSVSQPKMASSQEMASSQAAMQSFLPQDGISPVNDPRLINDNNR